MQDPGGNMNRSTPKWSPMKISNPSTKLRQARSMPQWVTRDTPSSSVVPPPPPPENVIPPVDPDYEVIEFPSQQYSNTEPIIEKVRKSKTPGRCDLCGSSIPTVKCEQCPSQHFCASCDDMYHRHPKRQHHSRKALGPPLRPPLPPKGEPIAAPVPPPRRNKHSSGRSSSSRFTPSPLSSQFQLSSSTHTLKKEPSGLIGSLKRFMGGRPLPPPPHMLSRDSRMSQPTLQLKHMDYHQHDSNKPSSIDSGYLDWDSDRRTRSGSFSAINHPMPAFGVMGQAQSMAQLNCPSCLHHPPGAAHMAWNDWNSTLNLQHTQAPSGWNTLGHQPHHMNTWHGSQMLPPPQFTPREEFSRRNSLRQSARRSRRDSSSERSDFRHRDDVRSRHVDSSSEEDLKRGGSKHSRHGGRSSPAMSYRSRHPLSDIDSEDDTMSRKGGRRRRRKSPVPPSPAMSRKSRGRHSPVKSRHRKQVPSRANSSDTDSELSSEIEVKRTGSVDQGVAKNVKKLTRSWSKSSKAEDTRDSHTSSVPSTERSRGWECEHCTLVNPPGTTVCSVCCKTSNASLAKSEEDIQEDLQKLKLEDKAEQSGSNGKQENGLKKGRAQSVDFLGRSEAISTGTSPPPQSISTQTYDYGGGGNPGLKRATSLADDVWRPIIRPMSRQSTLDSQSMATSPIPTPDVIAQDRAAYEFHKFTRSQSQLSQRLPSATDQHQIIRPNFRRAGSQPPEYFSTAVQNQVKQGLEMVKLLREAEQNGFTAEDLTIALSHCGDSNPVTWLINNWRHMMDTVVTLASNYGHEKGENNNVGTLSAVEARDALRLHNGNVWAAVTECVETRQKKFNDLMSRGNFTREDIITVLTANHGNVESAFVELNKTQLKPFLMRIWGPPQGLDNDCGDVSRLRLEEDDIAKNNGEVESPEVSYVRDWLFDEKFLKHNRSQSLSEINQESFYDDFEDHGDKLAIGNIQLRYDKNKDSQVTHRISTIYSSNVDLRINTEPKQYELEEKVRDESMDYIDDDDAESLTIRNTLHNEYVAAIVSNDTHYTNETVNKTQAQQVEKVDVLPNLGPSENRDALKIRTAFVPYLKLKPSGDSQDSNISIPSEVEDQVIGHTTLKTLNSINSPSTPHQNLTLEKEPRQSIGEPKPNSSNPSQELKYTNSFSGKNCKKPNVAKRKLTKSMKSVKRKVKSKFMGQKTNEEPEKVSLEISEVKKSPPSQHEDTKSVSTDVQNESMKIKNKEKTVVQMKRLQEVENIAPFRTNDIKFVMSPKESKNTKDKSPTPSVELLGTSENTTNKTDNTTTQSNKIIKELAQMQKNGQQPVGSKRTNVESERSTKIEKSSLIVESLSKSKENHENSTSKTAASNKTATLPKEIAPNTKAIDSNVNDESLIIVGTKTGTHNDELHKNDKHPSTENKSFFQAKKTIKAKNKRNRWNKKNQNVEKKKTEIETTDIKHSSHIVDEDKGSNAIQQARVTEVNIIDDKPKEKVTVEFEKDIIFVSDGETHKLIINPQIDKIELLKEIDSSDNENGDEDKHETAEIKTKVNETVVGQNSTNSKTSIQTTIKANAKQNKIQIIEQKNNVGTNESNNSTDQIEPKINALVRQGIPENKEKGEVNDNKLVVTSMIVPIPENKSVEIKNDNSGEEMAENSSETDEDEWEDDDDEEMEEKNKKRGEEIVQKEEKKNVNPKNQDSQMHQILKIEEEKPKNDINRLDIKAEESEEEEVEEEEEEYTDEYEEEDDTTESSNIITKQYMKPTNKGPETQTESDTNTDDQYLDAKDSSSSSGKVESSTDENSDFLSVQSEFSQLDIFLNEMVAHPKSPNNFNREIRDARTTNKIEKVEPKMDPPVDREDEKKKAVQILTSKISQIQMQENFLMPSNRMSPSTDSKRLQIKIDSPTELFQHSALEIKIESPSTSNSEKEVVVLNAERAGTSSSADISSEILDSSSRCDPRDMHKTSPQKTIQNNENKENVKDETKMTMTENRQEILELLKQSLSNETLLEDIVNKLFSSVIGDTNLLNKDVNTLNAQRITNIVHNTNNADEREEEPTASQQSSAQKNQNNLSILENVSNTRSNLPPLLESTTDKRAFNLSPPPQSLAFSPTGSDGFEFEREVRRCLAEGLVSNYDQAELAVKLMRMSFDQELSIAAAKDCSTEQAALAYLQQECTLCAGKYPMGKMVSMLECEHHCCRDCAIAYFTLAITERCIQHCVCPFCQHPDLNQYDEDRAMNYFSNLDILLKSLVDEGTHELFQRKLRDRTLMQDPHFKWCTKCSSGFIADPRHKKFICPDCNSVTCAKCNRAWVKEHERKSCDEYSAWLELADPNSSISKHLIENDGIVCPRCNSKYALAKGGCMHLICPSCKYEFCSDCGRQFLMGNKCTVSPFCEKLGLHSHHPRNCLFYLRDKEPRELQTLLRDAGVEFKADEPPALSSSKCSVQLQREVNGELQDSLCNLPVESATLCRAHYIEYLAKLIHQYKLDPVVIFELNELLQELRRRGKNLPDRSKDATDQLYRDICIKIIQEEIPLE